MFCGQSSMFIGLAIVLVVLGLASSLPLSQTMQVENYLSQYGYLPPEDITIGRILDASMRTKAVRDFQSFTGLNITGEIDDKTVEVMSKPRCGLPDKFDLDGQAGNYRLKGITWPIKDLTYKISNFPRRLRPDKVEVEIERAFAQWSDYTDLSFTPKRTERVDIEIRFEENDHGDGYPFEGVGSTLAHAFYPKNGSVHFDNAEKWTINTIDGVNLFQVAVHEIGHALGLFHSEVSSAVMGPFYKPFKTSFKLESDDVLGIQALYGKKSKGTNRSIRSADKVDAMFDSDGYTYAFKGDNYMRFEKNRCVETSKLIANGWPGLPADIDAAFTYKNGETFFFKGTKVWMYNGYQKGKGYPIEINTLFPGIPDHLDAAMRWGGNGKIYFFKGTDFWEFDPLHNPSVHSSYPKPISNWRGLPNNLDAAQNTSRGYTYFFKGDTYYLFNNEKFSVDESGSWFNCETEESQ